MTAFSPRRVRYAQPTFPTDSAGWGLRYSNVEFNECLRELMHIVFTTKRTEDMPHYLPYYTLGFGKGQS